MRNRRRLLLGSALAALMLTATGCTFGTAAEPSATSGATPADDAPGEVSAILVQPLGDGQVVRGSDEMDHVEYSLLVVNVFSHPVTLTAVTVLDSGGEELMTVEGDTLAAATQSLYTHAPSAVVEASAAAAVEVDLVVPPGEVPGDVTHRIQYTLPDGIAGAAIVDGLTVNGPEVAVDRSEALVIAPPLAGDGWLATSACCSPNVHRDLRLAADGLRMATAEVFAVDWARVEQNRVYEGDGRANEMFYGFGADVLAVADGTVVAAQDGVEESIPFASVPPDTKAGFGGNQIILEIAPGVYAAYAHLQPGSLAVEVGDTVRTGDVLAKLGNTGPSQGPHLHFGLLDKPDLFVGRSLPFVLDAFTLAGTVDISAVSGDELVIEPASGELSEVYPLYETIVDFG